MLPSNLFRSYILLDCTSFCDFDDTQLCSTAAAEVRHSGRLRRTRNNEAKKTFDTTREICHIRTIVAIHTLIYSYTTRSTLISDT